MSHPPIPWTPEQRRALHPRRSGAPPLPLPSEDPAAAFGRLLEHWAPAAALWERSPTLADPELGPRLRAVRARMDDARRGWTGTAPPVAAPEVEGTLLAMLSFGPAALDGEVLSWWADTAGLPFAVEALAASRGLWIDNPGGLPKMIFLAADPIPMGIRHWLDLRRRLAAAPEAEWATARDTAARLRTGAPLELRVLLAYLFPDVPAWAEEDAWEALAGKKMKLAGCLACTLADGALLDALAAAVDGPERIAPRLEGYTPDVRGTLLTLVDGAGRAAVPALASLLDRAGTPALRRDCLAALSLPGTPETAAVLAARAGKRDAAAALQELSVRHPRQALEGIAAHLIAHEEEKNVPLLALLTSLARREPEAAAAHLPGLPDKIRRLLAAAVAPGDLPREATPAELPPVLTRPPWTRKRPAPPSLDRLAADPLDLAPARPPRLPSFWQPAAFARPLLRGRTAALSLPAVETLGQILAFSRLDEPYAGIAQVREACDPASCAAFAWDLFNAWLTAAAPAKEQWAFNAIGHLGDDACARRLAPLIRDWPSEGVAARAVMGLDVLRALGTDVSLMYLHGFAQKTKSKALQDKARDKIAEVAEQRGLTPGELADRLVPDLGLDTAGSLLLDAGPRAFRVGFDEHLRPFLRDAAGKLLPDLPKPAAADDPEKAQRAQETWKALKKDAKTLAAQQILRLELAMCGRRRWEPEVFRMFFVEHPLVQHLARRLVWGAWDTEGETLRATFRVVEDATFADAADDPWTCPDGVQIGLLHSLDLTAGLAARWIDLFADYKILQPFSQLGRETWTIEEPERDALELHRLVPASVATGKILALAERRGWRRGPTLDNATIYWFAKPLPDNLHEARLPLEPGLTAGLLMEHPEQKAGPLTLHSTGAGWGDKGEIPFGTLDPVTFSELVRDLESLR